MGRNQLVHTPHQLLIRGVGLININHTQLHSSIPSSRMIHASNLSLLTFFPSVHISEVSNPPKKKKSERFNSRPHKAQQLALRLCLSSWRITSQESSIQPPICDRCPSRWLYTRGCRFTPRKLTAFFPKNWCFGSMFRLFLWGCICQGAQPLVFTKKRLVRLVWLVHLNPHPNKV